LIFLSLQILIIPRQVEDVGFNIKVNSSIVLMF
jgi:hypothetical protein